MRESSFRLLLGATLLVLLFFQLNQAALAISALMAFEAVTNWRIPALAARARGVPIAPDCCAPSGRDPRFEFEAERAFRLTFALMLTAGVVFEDLLWWLPWFMGFALVGAGLSGVCPMMMAFRWLGFR